MTENQPLPTEPDAALVKRLLAAELRLRESTLDLYSSLGLTNLRDLQFQVSDYSGIAGNGSIAPPWYQQNQKFGEAIPVYRSEIELRLMRDRSRVLCEHNEFALCAIENRINYIVGDGFKYSASPKCITEKSHRESAARVQAVIDGWKEINDTEALESEALRRFDVEGEFFIRTFKDRRGWLHCRFVEPEHVTQPGASTNDPANSFGIETDDDDVATVHGYHVVENPTESNWSTKLIGQEKVLHVKANSRQSWKRGLPTFFPVEQNLRRCEDLLASMSSMAKARAKIALIRKVTGLTTPVANSLLSRLTSIQATDPATSETLNIERLRYGTILTASGNTEYEMPAVQLGASDIVEVLQAELRAVASRLQMPEWMFTALADAKYSNAFVVEAPCLKAFRRLQRTLRNAFGLRKYGHKRSLLWRQLIVAVDAGILSPDDLENVNLSCEGPTLEARDRMQEVERHEKLVQGGFESKETAQRSLELEPDVESPLITREQIGKARPVTDSTAVMQIQTAFIAGQLPREAAAANLMILLGFTRDQAEELLPIAQGVVRAGQPDGAGGGGAGGGGGAPAGAPGGSGGATGEPQPSAGGVLPDGAGGGDAGNAGGAGAGQADPADQLVSQGEQAAGLTEQRLQYLRGLQLREAGFTGEVTASNGVVYHYVDGKRVAKAEHEAATAGKKISPTVADPDPHQFAAIIHTIAEHAAKGDADWHTATKAIDKVLKKFGGGLDKWKELGAQFGFNPAGKSQSQMLDAIKQHLQANGVDPAKVAAGKGEDAPAAPADAPADTPAAPADAPAAPAAPADAPAAPADAPAAPADAPAAPATPPVNVAEHAAELKQEVASYQDAVKTNKLTPEEASDAAWTSVIKMQKAGVPQADIDAALAEAGIPAGNQDAIDKHFEDIAVAAMTPAADPAAAPAADPAADPAAPTLDVNAVDWNDPAPTNAADVAAMFKHLVDQHKNGAMSAADAFKAAKKVLMAADAAGVADTDVAKAAEDAGIKLHAKAPPDNTLVGFSDLSKHFGVVPAGALPPVPDIPAGVNTHAKTKAAGGAAWKANYDHVKSVFGKGFDKDTKVWTKAGDVSHLLSDAHASDIKLSGPQIDAAAQYLKDNASKIHGGNLSLVKHQLGLKYPGGEEALNKHLPHILAKAGLSEDDLTKPAGAASATPAAAPAAAHAAIPSGAIGGAAAAPAVPAAPAPDPKKAIAAAMANVLTMKGDKSKKAEEWKNLIALHGYATMESAGKAAGMNHVPYNLGHPANKVAYHKDWAQKLTAHAAGAAPASPPPAAAPAAPAAPKAPKVAAPGLGHAANLPAGDEASANVATLPADEPPPPHIDPATKVGDPALTTAKTAGEVAPGWANMNGLPGNKQRYGACIVRKDPATGKTQVLLVEPKNHFDGEHWVFPKGQHDQETPGKTAIKEALEESGHHVELTGALSKPFDSAGTTKYGYFVAKSVGEDPTAMEANGETASTKWVDIDDAHNYLAQSTKDSAKARNLKVLESLKAHLNEEALNAHNAAVDTKNAGKPKKVSDIQGLQSIGEGSTGAKVGTHNGQKYVVKDGGNTPHGQEQAANEVAADQIYKLLGANVPPSKLVVENGKNHKVAQWVEGKPLKQYLKDATPEQAAAVKKEIQKHFVATALLGNWDVAGAHLDNVKVDAHGTPHLIDNGGSFDISANATKKGGTDKPFTGKVEELDNLLDPAKNPNASSLFAGVTKADIKKQIANVLTQKAKILAATPAAHKAAMSDRIEHLAKWAATDGKPNAVKLSHSVHGDVWVSPAPGVKISTPKMAKPSSPQAVAYINHITPQEHSALHSYTGSLYGQINSALYQKTPLTGHLKAADDNLQSLYAKASPIPPTKLVRMFNMPHGTAGAKFLAMLARAQAEGKPIKWRNYQSAGPGGTFGSGYDTKFVIHNVTEGAIDAMPISQFAHENELLLNRGTFYRVKEVKQSGGETEIHMEQVPKAEAEKGSYLEAADIPARGIVERPETADDDDREPTPEELAAHRAAWDRHHNDMLVAHILNLYPDE